MSEPKKRKFGTMAEGAAASDGCSNVLRSDAVDGLRRVLEEDEEAETALFAIVEGIHDTERYDAYVKGNSAIFKPWASEFVVLARAYTKEMSRFCVLLNGLPSSGGPGSSGVDRMPSIICRGHGVLRWLLSDDYIGEGGNASQRHAASSHTQVYVLTGRRGAACAELAAREAASGSCGFVLTERWVRAAEGDPLAAALLAAGGRRLVAAGIESEAAREDEWSPQLHVVEGAVPAVVELWHFPSWDAVEACEASSAFQELASQPAPARVIAFGFGTASSP